MVDAATRVRKNAGEPWGSFKSNNYWLDNYQQMQAEDREIIRLVSRFFIGAFRGGKHACRAIDVGSGTNLYPALLMLPWSERILLSDYSASNVQWLRDHVLGDDGGPWTWQPFWREVQDLEGYDRISEPRKQLREACADVPGYAGIEERNVFGLPRAQWQLGTMFFVAESITSDPGEFRAAIKDFVGALEPGAPFAAAFMAGSLGYQVGDTHFPALRIAQRDVAECFTILEVSELRVMVPKTSDRVRKGYKEMIVATGYAGGR